MAIIQRLKSLQVKHDKIEDEIRKAYNKHIQEEQISLLKKQKLKLKEEIEQLKAVNLTYAN